MKLLLTSGQHHPDHHMHVTPTGTGPRMPNYPTARATNRPQATMSALVHENSPPPTSLIPNTPGAASMAQGTGSALAVPWPAPAIDSTHGAASGFNLRASPTGATNWTTVSGVTSPYNLSGLAAGAAIDVQLQSSNAAGTSAWSATSTLTTATAAPNTLSGVQLAK